MRRFNYRTIVVGLLACTCMLGLQSCDEENSPLGDLAEQCGFSCAAEGVAEGNASISGIPKVDAFFQAAVNFNRAAAKLSGEINASLDAIALSVGLQPGAAGAEIKAAVQAKLAANIDGGLTVKYDPPKCVVDANVALDAKARCEASATPPEATVECTGSCEVEVEAGAEVDCGAEADVVCTGTAPNLVCEGDCTGSCKLDVAATCDGKCTGGCQADVSGECEAKCVGSCSGQCSGGCAVEVSGQCNGTCEGSCDGACDGECSGSTDSGGVCDGECKGSCEGTCEGKCEVEAQARCDGECRGECSGTCEGKCEVEVNGSCEGECSGSCEMNAGAECKGKCEGECKYTPPDLKCEANAKVECKAKAQADAKVECSGRCDGEVKPPEVSAECEANVKAEANCSMECTPPSLDVSWAWNADLEGNVNAQAEFKAWLEGFKGNLSALLAAQANAEFVADAGVDLAAAAVGAVQGAIQGMTADANLMVAFKTKCALDELGPAAESIQGAGAELSASASAAVEVLAVIGG